MKKQVWALFTMLALTSMLLSACGSQSKDGAPNKPVADGGKETGGGFLGSFVENPWFIQNSTNIDYCIEIDEANFGVDLATAKTRIAEAFAFWKLQLATANREHLFQFVKLGTQEIREVSCDLPYQVKFYLGTLPEDLQKLLGRTPQSVIGQAVMTRYDETNLKAEGFIYISPAKGPLKPDPAFEVRWTIDNGYFLDIVLKHEIGHIFRGAGHTPDSLMAEEVPKNVALSTDPSDVYEDTWEFPKFNFFFPPNTRNAPKLRFSGRIGFFFDEEANTTLFGIFEKDVRLEITIAKQMDAENDSISFKFFNKEAPHALLLDLTGHWIRDPSPNGFEGCFTKVYLNEKQKIIAPSQETGNGYDELEKSVCAYYSLNSKNYETYEMTVPSTGKKLKLILYYGPQTMQGTVSELDGSNSYRMDLYNASLIP